MAEDRSSLPTETEARRILLVRLSHLGDVIHALPVYHAVREAFPSAELGWVVQREFASILEDLPGLTRVFHFGRKDGFRAWPRLREQLLAWGPSWVIDAQGNTKSAMVCLASGASRRTGMALCNWNERFAGLSCTDRAPAAAGVHAIDRAQALARHVAPAAGARFKLGLQRDRVAQGEAELRKRLPSEGGPLFILALSKQGDNRSWSAAQFAALARELHAHGCRVLLLSGPEEAPLGTALARELGTHANGEGALAHWIDQRGLPQLANFFSAAAAAGARLVACDSGPMHLAAACGLSVRLLAGPQDAARTGPWPPAHELLSDGRVLPFEGSASSPHRVLSHPNPPECQPCLARTCDHPRGPICLSELSLKQVADSLLEER